MDGLRFKRPIGAGADVKELEYVIALQQTSEETRPNATISSVDILSLLRSRYNLNISHAKAIQIVRSLGGEGNDQDDLSSVPTDEGMFQFKEKAKNVLRKAKDRVGNFSWARTGGSANSESSDSGLLNDSAGTNFDDRGEAETRNIKTSESTIKRSFPRLLKQLKRLHARQQQGEAIEESLAALTERITSNLKARVLERTKSIRNLSVQDDLSVESTDSEMCHQPDEENQTENKQFSNIDIPSVKIDDNDNQNESHNQQRDETRSFAKKLDESKKGVSFDISDDEGLQDSECNENLVEFLDLVQIVAILMIPCFARLVHNARHSIGKDGIHDEIIDDLEHVAMQGDKNNQEDNVIDSSHWNRIGSRFKTYGKQKLDIRNDDDLFKSYSAKEILETGRKALLKTIIGEDPVVDKNLVQLLLICHGEIEKANDPELIKEMVAVAKSDSGLFDDQALANAISCDLSSWDPRCEDSSTTFLYDVLGVPFPAVKTRLSPNDSDNSKMCRKSSMPSKPSVDADVQQSGLLSISKTTSVDLDHMQATNTSESAEKSHFRQWCQVLFPATTRGNTKPDFSSTFLGVDMVVDATSSILVHILIWVSFILSVLQYGNLLIDSRRLEADECGYSRYWCPLAHEILRWLSIAFILMTFGLCYILPLSMGNNPAEMSAKRLLFSSMFATCNSLVPFLILNWIRSHPDKMKSPTMEENISTETFKRAQITTLSVGLAVASCFFVHAVTLIFIKHERPHLMPPIFRRLVATACWNREARVYRAAKRKISKMLLNALRLHDFHDDQTSLRSSQTLTRTQKIALSSAREKTMRNFILYGESRELVGGVLWTWWKFFDGTLFDHEGLWVHTRLYVIQVSQVIIAFFFAAYLFIFANEAAASADELRNTVEDVPEWIMDIFPTGQMVISALVPAAFVAMISMFTIIIVYIPSSSATILKYRAKIFPSLGSPSFQKFRSNVDLTYLNTGNAIFGMTGSATVFFIGFGSLLFVFVWPITQPGALRLVIIGVGLAVTIGIRMLVTTACRKVQYRAYYRIHPTAARITSLALECWHMGLAASVIIVRIVQFLTAALFWVGRIDAPFLSKNVSILGIGFDSVPEHYVKDLLVHEAHRHPYVERLAQMYLMKLRYDEKFGSRAGSVWRQLLVLAVFPWLVKYRVFRGERLLNAIIDTEKKNGLDKRDSGHFLGVETMANETHQIGA